MARSPLRIVAIGAGSGFGRGTVVDLLAAPEVNELDCTLVLVDTDPAKLERMHKFALLVREHFGCNVKVEMTGDRREALAGASYVITSVAIKRYPLWEQDFRVPLAYGFKHVLGENGGPGAIFHALRNYELMIPICRDMEQLCPDALLLNYTNPESRIIRAVSDMTKIRSVGLCHGVFSSLGGASRILDKPVEEIDFLSGGLNHFYWVLKLADKRTGEDLYPRLRERALSDPDCPSMPPLVKKMVEVFGLYTYPSDDHIGEYLSFAHEFTGLRWHYGLESRQVPLQDEKPGPDWLEPYVSGEKPLDDKVLRRSGELAIVIILAIALDRSFRAEAVNVPNSEGHIAGLPADTVVEVPALVDGGGIHPLELPPIPEALLAFCRTQASIQKLVVEAYRERSRNLLLQALLLDPVVNSVANAEQMLDHMLELQKDYLPAFA
ncbi:MAG: alpha-glucosidase/alpha-galactosidase [Armatimonadota bacterium]|nr:MAG: alpha-glucosidase/alpha-galactosidase [Armatimonadota bacterium]